MLILQIDISKNLKLAFKKFYSVKMLFYKLFCKINRKTIPSWSFFNKVAGCAPATLSKRAPT